MKEEISEAIIFLTNLIRSKLGKDMRKVNMEQLNVFCFVLEDLLYLQYEKHWFPETPERGSAYRCIRINHKMDPVILKAGIKSGFDEEILVELLPLELTVWIDPSEVSYRIGETGSISVVFPEKGSSGHAIYSKERPSWPIIVGYPNIYLNFLITESYCSPIFILPPWPAYIPVSSPRMAIRRKDCFRSNRNISYYLALIRLNIVYKLLTSF